MKLDMSWSLVLIVGVAVSGCGYQNRTAVPQQRTGSTQPSTPSGVQPSPAPVAAGDPSAAAGDSVLAPRALVVIKLTDAMRFMPSGVAAVVGDTVEWQNVSAMVHTVTADPAEAGAGKDVRLPDGAKPFSSGYIKPGQSFKYVFSVPGTYKYFCIPHEGLGMVGQIVVNPAK